MSFTVIIPARYQASRFPGKLLAKLGNATVLEHCWRKAVASDAARVIVAVDDQRLYDAAAGFGAEVCMTSEDCPSGTDRVHQAAVKSGCRPSEVIVNLQGDEPLFASEDITRLAQLLRDNKDCSMASMMHRFAEDQDVSNPDMVKVVTDRFGRALYFSRSPIPYRRSTDSDVQLFRHLGIYAYTLELLSRFVCWPVAALEACEQLEQLRALSNGVAIAMVETTNEGHRGIDTPEDLEIVTSIWQNKPREVEK